MSSPQLEAELGSYARLVLGDTDSERYFALITKEIDAHGGDVGAGMAAAASWIAERLPVSALNAIVATPGELWALRYPGQHALHVLERPGRPGRPGTGPACPQRYVVCARTRSGRHGLGGRRFGGSSTARAAGACSPPAN